MVKTSLHWCRQSRLKKQQGFLTLELLCSLLLGGVALLLLLRTTSSILAGMGRVREELLLENARRHITMQLEKTLAFDAAQVKISGNKISCVGLLGNKKYLIYWEKQKLLQKTTTGAGSGVNPLSLEEVQLKDWQVRAVGTKTAALSFVLCSQNSSLTVRQQLYCYNGEVFGDE